jgi:hypothetical protein
MKSTEDIARMREMAVHTLAGDLGAIDRGVRLMELLAAVPWGGYSEEKEAEIRKVIGRFGEKVPDVVLAGGATTMAGYPGSCGDFLSPAAFVRVEIEGLFPKPQCMSFSVVVKGRVLDCYPSHRYLLMSVKAENYQVYATT